MTKSRSMHSQRPRSVWDAIKDEHMIDVLIELRRSGATGHWTAGDWDFVSNLMQQRFSQTFSRVQLVNRFRILRRYWRIVSTLRNRPGFDFDEKDLRLSAPEHAWDHFKDHWYPSDRPLIANVQRSTIPLFPKLCIIWPSRRSRTDDPDFESDGNDEDEEIIASSTKFQSANADRNRPNRKELDTDGNSGAEEHSSIENIHVSDSDNESRSSNTWENEPSGVSVPSQPSWSNGRNSSPAQIALSSSSSALSSGTAAPSSSGGLGCNLRSAAGKSTGSTPPISSSNTYSSSDLGRRHKPLRPATTKINVETRASARNAAAAAAAATAATAALSPATPSGPSSSVSALTSASASLKAVAPASNPASIIETRQTRSSSTNAPLISPSNNPLGSVFSTLRRSSRSASRSYLPFSQNEVIPTNLGGGSNPLASSSRSLAASNAFNDSSFASQSMLTSATAVGNNSDNCSPPRDGVPSSSDQPILSDSEHTVARLVAKIGQGMVQRFPQLMNTSDGNNQEISFSRNPDVVKLEHIESAIEWLLQRLNKPVNDWVFAVDDEMLTLAATAFATPHIATIFLKLPEKNRLGWLQRYFTRIGLRYAMN